MRKSPDWSAEAAAFIERGAPGAIFATEVAEMLAAAGAPVPAMDRVDNMATLIRALQVSLERIPARGKRRRGDRIQSALRELGRIVPSEDMDRIVGIVAKRRQPDLSGLPPAKRWRRVATVLAALYRNEVKRDAGWSRDGPAVRFIEDVIVRAAKQRPSKAAIAEALREAGIHRFRQPPE
jgi:hypothetical protein